MSEPDYKGFVLHLEEYDEAGIPWGSSDLIRLSQQYNTPIPKRKFNADGSDYAFDWTGTDMENFCNE